jgi:hypothetical protein
VNISHAREINTYYNEREKSMQEQKCRYCLSGETDFRDEFIRDLWNKIKPGPFVLVFERIKKKLPEGITPVDSVLRFHKIYDNKDAGNNRLVKSLVTLIKTSPALREPAVSYLLLLLAPNLKRLGCEYCDGFIPVYDPFDEAVHAAYRIITKSKFKKKDLVLVSIIRRVRGELNRLTKKELRKRELIEKIATENNKKQLLDTH